MVKQKSLEKKASNKQTEVKKLYKAYLKALTDADIKFEIKSIHGFESIYVGKIELARLRHSNVFSIVSKFNSSGKAERPSNKKQIEKLVAEQLNNLQKA